MKNRLRLLIEYALEQQASDIHMTVRDQTFTLFIRILGELRPVRQDLISEKMLEYLRFASGMDLCRPHEPQSGKLSVELEGGTVEIRCSFLESKGLKTCTLRLLHNARFLPLHQLTHQNQAIDLLEKLTDLEHGLVLCCGPTGAGKTTTIHALLQMILAKGNRKIVTLEDPVEITQDGLLQLSVQNESTLSYERGIEELMRHDPDVIFLGECRSEYCASMAIRAALTGHLVFTTIHAANGPECLHRLLDLHVNLKDLQAVCKAITAQKLITQENKRSSIYEIWCHQPLEDLLRSRKTDPCLRPLVSMQPEEEERTDHEINDEKESGPSL